MTNDKRYAVLIDADNISDKYIKFILDEISNDGIATYKRIYGDWTKPSLGAWKTILLEHSVTPIQQYGYTTGKNATDSAMIIDAMDILYSNNVDGFCLVTSDSDFTRLAARMRESGMDVVGMGEKKTPKPFIAACNKFKYLDLLAVADEPKQTPVAPVKKGYFIDEEVTVAEYVHEQEDTGVMTNLEVIKKAILTIAQENSDEDEWLFIGDLGN
ncbi:MAG: NYN domain-containing protein, partial [Anaerovorax sp.]